VGREREREFDVEVRLNAGGYRQAEFSPRAEGRRIVAIGDSFTFGHGVEGEQAYPRVLERLLAERDDPAQVVNAGVPGRWVDEYYLELRERSLALAPDLVLLGLFVGNDIDGEDARTHVWRERDENGRPLRIDVEDVRVEEGYRVQKVKKARWSLPVVRDSHLAQLVIDTARGFGDGMRPPRLKEADVFRPVYSPETEAALSRVEDLLLAIRDLCRARGAELLVVLIPMRQQVYPAERRGHEDLDWDKPQRLVADFLGRNGVAWIDLRPALVAASGGDPLYFAIDSHWTARGHEVAAAAVAEHVATRGLLRRTHAS
jgi:lysophospholipase L1-like esterase